MWEGGAWMIMSFMLLRVPTESTASSKRVSVPEEMGITTHNLGTFKSFCALHVAAQVGAVG